MKPLKRLLAGWEEGSLSEREQGELADQLASTEARAALVEHFLFRAVAREALREDPVCRPELSRSEFSASAQVARVHPNAPMVGEEQTVWCRAVLLHLPRWLALAAGLALVTGGGWRWWQSRPMQLHARLESTGTGVTVQRGEEQFDVRDQRDHQDPWLPKWGDVIRVADQSTGTIRLRDDTTLTLAGDSELTFASDTTGLHLLLNHGELEANVTKQPAGRPLVCETPQGKITVLGTRFVVAVRRTETYLTVQEGRVRVAPKGGGEPVEVVSPYYAILTANQPVETAIFTNSNPQILADGWTGIDLGPVGLAGTARVEGSVIEVSAAGAMGQLADASRFVYRQMEGNCEIVARVASLEAVTDITKAGVMIRHALEPGGPTAVLYLRPDRTGNFVARDSSGHTVKVQMAAKPPHWLRLVRINDRITGYHSSDGIKWKAQKAVTMPLGQTVFIGVAVASERRDALALATFDAITTKSHPPQ